MASPSLHMEVLFVLQVCMVPVVWPLPTVCCLNYQVSMSATIVSVSASSLSNIGYKDVLQILLGGRGTQCSSRSAWATESGKRLFNFLCYVCWHWNV